MEIKFKVERMYKFQDNPTMKAFVDVAVNDVLIFKGVRVIQGQKALFVTMPQEQGKDKRWYDVIRITSPDVRDELTRIVLEEYNQGQISDIGR